MKLLIITAINVFEKEVKKILKKSGIKTFSYTDIKGFRDSTEESVESNWFASEMNENESLMFYSFADKEKTDFYNYEEKALKKPAILFPAEFFLEDVFGDCSISEKAFNIMILTKTEKDLFTEIRNRNVNEVKLLPESDKTGKVPYSILDENGKLNTESIKKIKILMGTKAYEKGVATLKNGSKLKFSSNTYAVENS